MNSTTTSDRSILGHEVFRTVLLALAYPGRPQPSPLASVPQADRARATATAMIEAVWERSSDVIFVDGTPEAATLLGADRGTDDAPQRGATLIALVPERTPQISVELAGPGIDGVLAAALPLGQAALDARNEACAAFPLGIDCLFVEHGGAITALPRTTRVRAR